MPPEHHQPVAKTHLGKPLGRSIQAIAEGRDPGDLTALDDLAGIVQIRGAVAGQARQSGSRRNGLGDPVAYSCRLFHTHVAARSARVGAS